MILSISSDKCVRNFSALLLVLTFASSGIFNANAQENSFEKVHVIQTNQAFSSSSFLTTSSREGVFPIVRNGTPSDILISASDYEGIPKLAGLFQKDLGYVSGKKPKLHVDGNPKARNLIIAGSLGKSSIIDKLVSAGKIDASELEGAWEKFLILPVKNPMDGVDNALVIVGSDKRGTIYGMFELSEEMGVSPWYWWADVPVKSRKNIYAKAGVHTLGEPKVKYRGIFLNDEEPALGSWAREKFGGINHKFYEKVFELILRQKGNFLWPAMWGKSLWEDDPLSAPLANEMGVVLSNSHHEPMMRAQSDWGRSGEGPWNYETNAEKLREFWREGIERTQGQEKIVTLAMRGDGDEAMSEDTNIELLEQIVEDQREIIEDVTGKRAKETPQVWALYKEVQDYYDKGMRMPEDVTLLYCDDNWGHVRVLPELDAAPRSGGYGMYYHFDFVGGPRSYKWHNTAQIERVWEQMRLTYEYGVREIWLVNVGDLKPMDLPINFFLDYAWNPDAITSDDLPEYYTQWAAQQFGSEYAEEIGEILSLYTKYNSRRKPELVSPETYSLTQFNEAERVVEEYNSLLARAQNIESELTEEVQNAYYQLVMYPVEANANLNEMYVSAAKNQLHYLQNRASTNYYADKTKELFFRDAEFTEEHHEFADGKWNHMMAQTHIGYTTWSDPPVNKMPSISYIQTATQAGMGYMLESGIRPPWGGGAARSFTPFDPANDQKYYVEIYNTGTEPLSYSVSSESDWIEISSTSGTIEYDEKVYISVDWDKVPEGTENGELLLSGSGRNVSIIVPLHTEVPNSVSGYIENDGIVSIDAPGYQNKKDANGISWEVIPNLGRTSSGVTSKPVTSEKQTPGNNSPYLEYTVIVLESGNYDLHAWFSPTLNFQKDEGLLYAFSVNGSDPTIMNLHENAIGADWTYPAWWNNAVTDNIMKQTVMKVNLDAGEHTIRYYLVDPGLVLQKILLTKEGKNLQTYLGPPQSVKK